MFDPVRAFSGFSTDDIAAAADFYGRLLGLATEINEMGILEISLPGGGTVIIYPRPGHQPAVFTVLNFSVDDIDRAVAELTAAGIVFERYDGMDQDESGVMRGNGPDIAWFTDPAGNILSIIAA